MTEADIDAGDDEDEHGGELLVHLTMRLGRAGQRRSASEDPAPGREATALAFAQETLTGPPSSEREVLTSLLLRVRLLDRQRTGMLAALAGELHQAQTADRVLAARRERAGLPAKTSSADA